MLKLLDATSESILLSTRQSYIESYEAGTLEKTLDEDRRELEHRRATAAFKLLNEEVIVKFTSLNEMKELLRSLCSTDVADMVVKPVDFFMTGSQRINTLFRYENMHGVLEGLSHDSYNFREQVTLHIDDTIYCLSANCWDPMVVYSYSGASLLCKKFLAESEDNLGLFAVANHQG